MQHPSPFRKIHLQHVLRYSDIRASITKLQQ
jgi:hypothetical protein